MAIPIKTNTPPKIQKKESRVIKSGSEDYEIIRKLACDLLIANQNQTTAYDMFRRATQGDAYTAIDSQRSGASIFFNKVENIQYMEFRKVEIYKHGFDEFCKLKGIEHTEFNEVENKVHERLIDKTPSEIRVETLIDLQRIIDSVATDDITLLAAIKQRTELSDAKYKDKGAELSATEKSIIFYLPAPLCSKCPNKSEIENQFKQTPEVDAEIAEYIGLNDEEDDEAGN